MVHFTTVFGLILSLMAAVAILALVLIRVAVRKGKKPKLTKALFSVFVVLGMLLIGVVITRSAVSNNAKVIDVEYISDHTVVETKNLVIKEEKGLTIMIDDDKTIGIYPTLLVKNMFGVDESGHITPDVGSINLTVRSNKPIKAVSICGIWFITDSSSSWVTRVVLD